MDDGIVGADVGGKIQVKAVDGGAGGRQIDLDIVQRRGKGRVALVQPKRDLGDEPSPGIDRGELRGAIDLLVSFPRQREISEVERQTVAVRAFDKSERIRSVNGNSPGRPDRQKTA